MLTTFSLTKNDHRWVIFISSKRLRSPQRPIPNAVCGKNRRRAGCVFSSLEVEFENKDVKAVKEENLIVLPLAVFPAAELR